MNKKNQFLSSKVRKIPEPPNVTATVAAINAQADAMSDDEVLAIYNRYRKKQGLSEVPFQECMRK